MTPHLIVQARDTQNYQNVYWLLQKTTRRFMFKFIFMTPIHTKSACLPTHCAHKFKFRHSTSFTLQHNTNHIQFESTCRRLSAHYFITLDPSDTVGFVLWAGNVLYVPNIVYFPFCASPMIHFFKEFVNKNTEQQSL